MKKYLLSIDQGTTSCRAIVFDTKGDIVAVGQREFTQHYPQPGWVEHDAEEILTTQIACIKEAVEKALAGDGDKEIACVGITNQRETTVVWDKKTLKPVYRAIVWQCRRTQNIAESIKDDNRFRERTGLVPDAYFSGPKIKWILDNVEGARARAEKGELAFGTIDSWLIANLTKEKNHYTEVSNASRTLLFNAKEMVWDKELMQVLDVPESMMPTVVPSDYNFGTTSKELLGFEAPILANLGDQQAALFGQGCFEPGMAKCTYGTGSFLLSNIGEEFKLADGLLTTVAWQQEGKQPVYAFEGAIFVAGAAIQWLRDGLGLIENSEESENLATSIKSNDGVYFVPALVGLGSPWWNSDVRGTIVGLTRGSGREHFVRAALESMTYQVKDVIDTMQEDGIDVTRLRVDGGATKNNFMLQFQSDILDIPVQRAEQVESTAWGVAAMAGIKCGAIDCAKKLAEDWRCDHEFAPARNREAEYDGWKRALKGAFACANIL
ncbi:MAG: glycerol kinase GlpK [Cyanobacteriota/Melainabacteria group bacterium]